MKKLHSIILSVVCGILVTSTAFAGNENRWSQLENSRISLQGTRYIVPNRYISFELDVIGLRHDFVQSVASQGRSLSVSVPDPDGVMQQFRLIPAEVMHPDLASRYPQIITFAGVSVTDPRVTARFDFTQFGFHAMVMAPGNSWFVDPYSLEDTDKYMVYYKRDFTTSKQYDCGVDESLEHAVLPASVAKSIGSELKTYRLAMAATGEYTAFYGGTVAGALAGIVTSVNRVTGVYEREFAIRMTLVPNTDTLIFTNATTDPYTNSSGGTMLGQNQTTVTARIGAANYDIGHVFSTGGGGIAGLGVVCNFSQKARGVTGSSSPIGDPFDIDYVAHEIGHQFGGNHTFNAETGACSGNRAFNAAYEPGSGSTIMAYAGICSGNNLQPNSDDFFHTKSFDEITIYTTTGVGSNCPVVTQTGNTPPTINPGGNYIIPYLTPFKLTGSATDPDLDSLTYCWEQFDLGPAGTWNAPVGNAPIFRSFDPTPNPVRLFPKLTVRDNKLNGGGVTNNDTPIAVDVINTGVPFAITSPNTTGILWSAGGVETVTWDVASTDLAPISTPNVNILLSTDGGQTFPTVLASNVPNNGSAQVNVPNITTTTARVWVEGAGNIFFDINDKNFAIGPVGISESFDETGVVVSPNPATDHLNVTLKHGSDFVTGETQVLICDISGRSVFTQVLTETTTRIQTSGLASGIYMVKLTGNNGATAVGRVIVGWQR